MKRGAALTLHTGLLYSVLPDVNTETLGAAPDTSAPLNINETDKHLLCMAGGVIL